MTTTPETKPVRTRSGGRLAFLLVVVAIVAGMFINYYAGPGNENEAAFQANLQARQCVVGTMNGKKVESYRCALPTAGEYVTEEALRAQAADIVTARGATAPTKP